MYQVLVWSIRNRCWKIVLDNASDTDAAACWRRLYNNGMAPRVVRKDKP